ncbi:MAG: PatB family C-S lyase [Anaerolineales bacterium]|jgi:cystathionine beta-lyase
MPSIFDHFIERRGSNSLKWQRYPEDVLPLWVADMDFAAPQPVLAALRAKVKHGVFGYENLSKELAETTAVRMQKLYGWRVSPERIIAIPGVVAGFNAAARAFCRAGHGILIQPPVYPPFLTVHENVGLVRQLAPLKQVDQGNRLHYEIDWQVFEAALHSGGARTDMFLLCSPHNPTGILYAPDNLARLADLCLKGDILICSDEIHNELLLGGKRHCPIAGLRPEIAERTITLIAPSKTFNIPGLFCAFALVPNQDLFELYQKTVERMSLHVNSLGMAGAQAAFSGGCEDWLAELLQYLTANRDYLVQFVESELPGIKVTVPDATYLAWLDCNSLIRDGWTNDPPAKFFLDKARVALNPGVDFGPGGEGFVRLNFGCPRSTLAKALERMKTALKGFG